MSKKDPVQSDNTPRVHFDGDDPSHQSPSDRTSTAQGYPAQHRHHERDYHSCVILDICISLANIVATSRVDTHACARTVHEAVARLSKLAAVLDKQLHGAKEEEVNHKSEDVRKDKGKEKADDLGEELRAWNQGQKPFSWTPAGEGDDFTLKPTFEKGRKRGVDLGTVEDDAVTCRPHRY